ncbi:hypothetical protein AB0E08_21665 [Streptomyces sp. NPDC048281]|uniref:hypothetical protein n=1 Tax=Streptomyces sp. NPDC048281 TaxID=3154715 RepID=UPI00341CE915
MLADVRSPEPSHAHEHIRSPGSMLQTRQTSDLPSWIGEGSGSALPGLAGFTKGPAADLNAVTFGFASDWSSGVAEDRICDLEMLKRLMYGRPSLPLLRKRVLLP